MLLIFYIMQVSPVWYSQDSRLFLAPPEPNFAFQSQNKPNFRGCWKQIDHLGLHLYLYKVAGIFDLRQRTPPRPLAVGGWNLDMLTSVVCRWLWVTQIWPSAIHRCLLFSDFHSFFLCKTLAYVFSHLIEGYRRHRIEGIECCSNSYECYGFRIFRQTNPSMWPINFLHFLFCAVSVLKIISIQRN